MKLIFTKEENNEITVKIQKGTVAVEFTYIEMINQLLEDNNFDDTDYNNLDKKEVENLEEMLTKITDIFEHEEGYENDNQEDDD